MQMITDIQIDLYGEEQYYLASAKQGDKATRFLRVQLMNNGNEFEIPDDVKLIANIQKPDGKFCYNECEKDGNRVMVQLTNQALAAAGKMSKKATLAAGSAFGAILRMARAERIPN